MRENNSWQRFVAPGLRKVCGCDSADRGRRMRLPICLSHRSSGPSKSLHLCPAPKSHFRGLKLKRTITIENFFVNLASKESEGVENGPKAFVCDPHTGFGHSAHLSPV